MSWRSSPVTGPGLPRAAGRLKPWRSHSAARVSLLLACRAARALNTRHKMTKFCTLGSCMRIEINYQAETLETAICEAIVTYLGYGMPACEIIEQLISRGFIRDPGNNAREDVVQRLADIADQMRHEQATQIR